MTTSRERALLARAEKLNLTVDFVHSRREDIPFCPNTKGGVTYCKLKTVFGDQVGEGVALCSPHDNFNKGVGRVIALGRALNNFDNREWFA